ncbi:MAG: sterol-binding protein, partial [Burkholderiales bacterium]
SLVVRLRTDAPAAALRGEEYLLRAIDVQGNARLASEIMFLARHLRWDVEEDLSRLVGDIAARRIAGTARTLVAWHADALRRLAEGVVEYATEEARLLVRRDELAEVADAHARLRDGLERLELRIRRMER